MNNEEKPKEYTFQLGEIQSCQHKFIRMGTNVECIKCGLGFFDPEGKFPLEEANNKFGKVIESEPN